ncbi:ribosomal protein S11 [Tanacetum coccineum]
MKEKKETGSRKNGRLGSRKSARRIPKGLIHVQASFNNTIVTVTDVRGRVVYWASAGTCGFRGTRRGTPFAAQTAAGNAIRTVVEQGTQRAEVMKKGPGLGIPSSKIEIPILEVSTPSQASSSASTSQMTIPDIGSSSQASSSASTSQMTLPDIGSTSEASSSASTAPRLTKNQRSAIKLAVMMSIFVASGVLMELITLEYDAISPEYQAISPFEFYSHQQLVLSDLGGVTMAFEELVVHEVFEKAFRKKFPGVIFSRYLGEVIIYSTDLDQITFNESAGYALLNELRLPGEIVSIGPGDHPLRIYKDRSPTSDNPAIELRFGSCDNTMHKDVKTKYHSTVVNGFDVHVGPHTISKKSFMVSPPIKIRAVAVPADR